MANIQEALRLEGITTAVVNFYHVTKQEAVALGLKGSPSVLINKIDIQPIDITGFS